MINAIITGATHGIGAAIANKLASRQASLIIAARNEAELSRMESDLRALGARQVLGFPVDVADAERIRAFCAFIAAHMPEPDILVNNAGVFLPGNLCDEAEGHLEFMMQTNLFSAYHITRGIVPLMKKRRKGHIFNMCSVASLKAYPQGGSYSISKYALLGFSDNLREELKADQIRVTAICPGATNSRSWSGSGIPEERLMKSEDVAEMVWACYTLSDRADVETIVMRPQLGDL